MDRSWATRWRQLKRVAVFCVVIDLFVSLQPIAWAQDVLPLLTLDSEDDPNAAEPGPDDSAADDETPDDESPDSTSQTSPDWDPTPPQKPAAVNPCAAAYKPVYYDNDFSYLTDPN